MTLYQRTAIMFNKSFTSQKGYCTVTLYFLWMPQCYCLMRRAYWHNHIISPDFCSAPVDGKLSLPASSNQKKKSYPHAKCSSSLHGVPIQYEKSPPGRILWVKMTMMSFSDGTCESIFLSSTGWIRATRWSDKTNQDSVLWLFFSK